MNRLQALSASPTVRLCGPEAANFVANITGTLSGLVGALKEVFHLAKKLEDVLQAEFSVSPQLDEIQATTRELEETWRKVGTVERTVTSTHFCVLTQCRYPP